MPLDKAGLLNALIFDVALPEITNAIRKHREATGEMPTDDQVKALLQADMDRIVTTGDSYLAKHGFHADVSGSVVTGSLGD